MYARSQFLKVSGVVAICLLLLLVSLSAQNALAGIQQATMAASAPAGVSATTAATTMGTAAAATMAATGGATTVAPSGLTVVPGTTAAPTKTATATLRAAGAATVSFVPCTPSSTPVAMVVGTVSGVMTATPMGTLAGTMQATPKPGFIGIVAQQVDSCGARVMSVEPTSPASRAGLQQGDVIVAFDDQAIVSLDAMHDMLEAHKAGDTIRLTIQRSNRQVTISVILGDGMAF